MPRRSVLQMAAKGLGGSALVAAGFPAIVPASVFGAAAPSNRINVGAIGTGRIALPLADRGVIVHGIELSEAMAAKKPVPGNHSPEFAPVPEPSIRTGAEAMSLLLLDVLQKK
jgi:hypothetical protein